MRSGFIVLFIALSLHAVAMSDAEEKQFVDQITKEMARGEYKKALQEVDELVKEKEWELYFLYRLRANNYFWLGEYENARDDYIRALLRSDGGDIEYRLGDTFLKLKQPNKAIFYLDKALAVTKKGDRNQILSLYSKSRALCLLK